MLFNVFFFFNDTATTEIYTLSLHDALPILPESQPARRHCMPPKVSIQISPISRRRKLRSGLRPRRRTPTDRKSTRLNSSHANISYAVFCLKKKKKNNNRLHTQTIVY